MRHLRVEDVQFAGELSGVLHSCLVFIALMATWALYVLSPITRKAGSSALEKGVPIRSIGRCIAVLQAINRAGSLTMMDVAHASGVPYPTACRIVQTLLYEGLIEREPARKRYRPTALVQTLSHGFQAHGRLVDASRAHIVELTKRLGWPVSLTSHVGQRMVVRDSTHTLTTLTFNNYYPGYTLPILESASGCVHIAFTSEDDRANILSTLRAVPENSNNNTLALFESGLLVREIQNDGYATKGHNRYTENPGKTSSIAAPVFDNAGVAGAVTLIFFSSAMKMANAIEKYADDVKRTAATITAVLRDDGTQIRAA
jgi:IclR family mhp operon transcriptional activator